MESSVSSPPSQTQSQHQLAPDLGSPSLENHSSYCHVWSLGLDSSIETILSPLLEEYEHISPFAHHFQLHLVNSLADVCAHGDSDMFIVWNATEEQALEALKHSKLLPPIVVVLGQVANSEGIRQTRRNILEAGASDCLAWDELSAPTLERSLRLALTQLAERSQTSSFAHEARDRDSSIIANVPGVIFRVVYEPGGAFYFDFVSELAQAVWGHDYDWKGGDMAQHLARIHPDDRTELIDSFSQSARDITLCEWSGRLLDAEGQWRWVRSSAQPKRRDDGAIVWDGLVTDETNVRKWQAELERSQRALEKAQDLAQLGSFDWNMVTGHIEWSDSMFRIYGYEPKSIVPSIALIFTCIHPDDIEYVKGAIERVRQNGRDSMRFRIRRPDGQERMVQANAYVELDEQGMPVRFLGATQDVTDTLVAQQALRNSEERYALAARGSNDGLWDWNLVSDKLYLSPRWFDMIGVSPYSEEGDPNEWLARIHPDDLPAFETILDAHLIGASAHFECEYRLKQKGGGWKWMLGRGLAVRDANGNATRIAGSQTDISERKHVESQLEHSAFYDSLTGLPNRALFLDRLETAIARAARDEDHSFAVLFLDLDRFKNINDSLGHLAGDTLLIEAGHRFAACLRPSDTVARLGGDEFAILLEGLADNGAIDAIATRIRGELERPFLVDGHEVFITVSIGVAPAQGKNTRAVELLRNADTAMYRAKGLGRAQHATFDASMHQRAVRMLEIESELWRALERKELRLHFQPIIELTTGQISGFEALVRWEHPQRGLVPPNDFIPIAEETGLIVPIGWWVLEEACRQAMDWDRDYTMAVNLSSQQFSQRDCLERVRGALEKTGFDPKRLKLEITESVLMQNTESASAMLHELKEMGITLAMDDFGTGYSSLSYLHRFPLDVLKIDRSFVAQMNGTSESDPLVNTILDLARSLNVTVVAEGVESEEQLRLLRGMGCHFAQGYFFARPLDPPHIEQLLVRSPHW